MLPAAAGSVTRGRRSCYSRPRVDDIVKDFWNPQCCFPIIKVLFGIKQYIYVGCSKSKKSWLVKRRCTNLRRRPEAKHCSSLCSQSEGDEYCGGQTRLKIQRRYALKRWLISLRVRGPHFASKVSYNAGAATDDCAGQCKSPLRGRYR